MAAVETRPGAAPTREKLRGAVAVVGMDWNFALGNDLQKGWEGMVNGVNGITRHELPGYPQIKSKIAGIAKDFDPERDLKGIIPSSDIPFVARSVQLILPPGQRALRQAGLLDERKEQIGKGPRTRTVWKINEDIVHPDDVATVVATGMAGAADASVAGQKMLDSGKLPPAEFVFQALPGRAATVPSMAFDTRGGVAMIDAECAGGNYSIGEVRRRILNGEAYVGIAGGLESTLTPVGYALFDSLGALSDDNDVDWAPHALDVHNSGFAYAEGAAVMVLEDVEHARARGANILGYLTGYGESGDAFHVSFPHPEGRGQERAMRKAIAVAGGLPTEGTVFWSGHLTGTGGDKVETQTVKRVARDIGVLDRVVFSGSKPMTGHTLGASGLIESIKAVKAIQEGVVPPIIKTRELDPEAEGIDVVIGESRKAEVTAAVVDSFGFGGPNAITVFESTATAQI
jgi:3-oxoacyl-(acyl-carrier-protein) synthase